MNNLTGISEKSLSEIKKILMKTLHTKLQYEVSVFGSRSKNKYKQYSDLDLWIECQPELTSKELSNLHSFFEESNLAIKIDIVTPETCLADYKGQILSEKKFWFGSLED